MRRKVCGFSNKWLWRHQWTCCLLLLFGICVYNALTSMFSLGEMPTHECVQRITTSADIKELEKQQDVKVLEEDTNLESEYQIPSNNIHTEDELVMVNVGLGRWDTSRTYKLFDNVAVGEDYAEFSSQRKVCLATQTSVERMDGIVEIADNWDGPISFAVFAAGEELKLVRLFISYLMNCEPNKFSRLAIHIVIPASIIPKNEHMKTKRLSMIERCLPPKVFVKSLAQKRTKEIVKWRLNNVYPQNHLRNVARKNCQTPFTFLVDIDIVPSVGSADGLHKFLQTINCKRCAFVVPTYELDERVSFPLNKTELVRLSKKGLALPFHKKVFIFNQFASNFSRWEESGGNESSDVHISHDVTNFELLYEPFYVASDEVPPHDERFLGYGYTRNSQVEAVASA